jgi:hypothetical protein
VKRGNGFFMIGELEIRVYWIIYVEEGIVLTN